MKISESGHRSLEVHVGAEHLPDILGSQIQKLNELDGSIKKALVAAGEAKDSADRARRHSAGWFQKKAAIEEIQAAGVDLAEAVQLGADAQRLSFELQTKLAEITKYLFGLGVTNIAANRMVVRELELRLTGASNQELSDLARREVLLVVQQLKDQEDILHKQESIKRTVEVHEGLIKENGHATQVLIERVDELNLADGRFAAVIEHHDARLQSESCERKQLEERLRTMGEVVGTQAELLDHQATVIAEQGAQIAMAHMENQKLYRHLEVHGKAIEALEVAGRFNLVRMMANITLMTAVATVVSLVWR